MQIVEAFQKPLKDLKTLAIGILVSIIPVINVLFLPGYLIRVARNTMTGNQSMPEWKELGNMVADSLKLMVIGLVYALPGLVVLFVALPSITVWASLVNFIAMVVSGNAGNNMQSVIIAGIAAGAGLFLFAILLLVAGGIGSTSAVLMYAKTSQLSSAFKFKEIYGNFFKGQFLKALAVVLVLSIVISIAKEILVFIPVLGILIYLLILFPMAVAFQSLLADAYGK